VLSPSHSFLRTRKTLEEQLVPAYAKAGGLGFAYAHGSLVEGLAERADLDLALVWDDRPPPEGHRLPERLADPFPEPTAFDQPGFVLDRFWLNGQQVDVKHLTAAEVRAWAGAVEAGEGRRGYPMPVVFVHGFVNGIVLSDYRGLAADLFRRLRNVPPAFQDRAAGDAAQAHHFYPKDLTAAAERGDGLLFHALAAEYLRALFIAWFAANDLYWPHEKRLGLRLRLMGRDDLAAFEEQVWAGQDLNSRLTAIDQLGERLLRETGRIGTSSGSATT
jgi:hypothetical protein